MEKEIATEVAERFPLRAYRPSQLCSMYEVSRKTFLKWVTPFQNEIGERNGHFYTINQVQIIIEKLGIPGKMIVDKD
jgi:hypothetical protein